MAPRPGPEQPVDFNEFVDTCGDGEEITRRAQNPKDVGDLGNTIMSVTASRADAGSLDGRRPMALQHRPDAEPRAEAAADAKLRELEEASPPAGFFPTRSTRWAVAGC